MAAASRAVAALMIATAAACTQVETRPVLDPCPDTTAVLTFAAYASQATDSTAQRAFIDAAEHAYIETPDTARLLQLAIAQLKGGEAAAARTHLELLAARADPACPATRELVALYFADLDRVSLVRRLAEANAKIEALTALEKSIGTQP